MLNTDNSPTGKDIGTLHIIQFSHPQGCRGYLVADMETKKALAVDPHLDFVGKMAQRIKKENWELTYIADTHTHADHPSGAGMLSQLFPSSTRLAHEKARHVGVTYNPADGDTLRLGSKTITIRHAPGHTPDHIVLITDGAIFSGDTLLIGTVARTDFLGGDAGDLFDTLQWFLADLPDDLILYPAHDYQGQKESTIGREKTNNPWLQIHDRSEFIKKLTINPPPRPANMDDLLRLNREGVNIPEQISAETAVNRVKDGGASSIIDVRTAGEVEAEHIPGSRHIPLDKLEELLDNVRITPAPRMLLCQSGNRAGMARAKLVASGIGGLSVIEGGINAYRLAGGTTVKGKKRISLERQVRIAAGILILLSVIFSYFVHPACIIIAGFVAMGLIFAGITDKCGMGLILLKMPWNQSSKIFLTAASGTCAVSPHGGCIAGSPGEKSSGGCAVVPTNDNNGN